ncbi:MAG: nucleoside triphosphate pyrophosphohydrolase [Acidobacteria bacterium]|nr:nucleoside triphosphate pyrophosphohydrolase [Acidobacteriota bacterium]
MARLRAPDGCPWDREQTPRSLRTYLLEETYEVLDAIERDDPQALKDELGDLLLQVVFHAQMAGEQGRFSIDDVLANLHDKLIRRHPHVFGTTQATSAEQVKVNWEALKAAEREAHLKPSREGNSILSGVSPHLPALLEAYQLTRRAAQVGFDWQRLDDLLAKLEEEVNELRQAVAAGDGERLEDEVGDLLFVAVNVARYLGLDPAVALRRTNRKFTERFQLVERELARLGKRPEEATLEEMDALWERSKEK